MLCCTLVESLYVTIMVNGLTLVISANIVVVVGLLVLLRHSLAP